jgi:hypothetical protein
MRHLVPSIAANTPAVAAAVAAAPAATAARAAATGAAAARAGAAAAADLGRDQSQVEEEEELDRHHGSKERRAYKDRRGHKSVAYV